VGHRSVHHIATGRRRHDEQVIATRGRAPAGLSIKEGMARKLATKSGAAIYSRRKVIVEPVFRSDQGGSRIQTLPPARARQGPRGMVLHRPHPQSPRATRLRIAAAWAPPGLPAGPQAVTAGSSWPLPRFAPSPAPRRRPAGRPPSVTETRSWSFILPTAAVTFLQGLGDFREDQRSKVVRHPNASRIRRAIARRCFGIGSQRRLAADLDGVGNGDAQRTQSTPQGLS
jgi:hypothetical protein